MATQLPSRLNQLKIFSWSRLLVLLILGVILLSSITIIQVQHQVRHLETSYAKALVQQENLREQTGRLLLEKHHLSALSRVEEVASNQLNMHPISSNKTGHATVFIKIPVEQVSNSGDVNGL